MGHGYWPFSARSAFISSLVLAVAILGLMFWAAGRENGGFEISGLSFVVALLAALVPVIALVLGRVTSVEAAGVKLSLEAVQEVVRTSGEVGTRALLAENLGLRPGQVEDSGSDTVMRTLADVVGNDVVVVDLREGEAWWKSRLLLLTAGAARLHNPRAIAFVKATPDRPQTYIGWASPSDILRRLLEVDPVLRRAHESADRKTLLWRLSSAPEEGSARRLPWAPSGNDISYSEPKNATERALWLEHPDGGKWMLPWPSAAAVYPHHVDGYDFLVPEHILRDEIRGVEQDAPDNRVTDSRLRDWLGSVLHEDSVDRDEDEATWTATIVRSTAEYFAVTSNDQLVDLIPRQRALNALMLKLVEPEKSA
ncbi:MAG: hypothetical protein OES24_01895 [Acidimicrobiia bacterium]|nr:hypothetical protein [Acidimicrobiia bacterium]